MLFDLFTAFDKIKSSNKSDIFLNARATCPELLSNISTMLGGRPQGCQVHTPGYRKWVYNRLNKYAFDRYRPLQAAIIVGELEV